MHVLLLRFSVTFTPTYDYDIDTDY